MGHFIEGLVDGVGDYLSKGDHHDVEYHHPSSQIRRREFLDVDGSDACCNANANTDQEPIPYLRRVKGAGRGGREGDVPWTIHHGTLLGKRHRLRRLCLRLLVQADDQRSRTGVILKCAKNSTVRRGEGDQSLSEGVP